MSFRPQGEILGRPHFLAPCLGGIQVPLEQAKYARSRFVAAFERLRPIAFIRTEAINGDLTAGVDDSDYLHLNGKGRFARAPHVLCSARWTSAWSDRHFSASRNQQSAGKLTDCHPLAAPWPNKDRQRNSSYASPTPGSRTAFPYILRRREQAEVAANDGQEAIVQLAQNRFDQSGTQLGALECYQPNNKKRFRKSLSLPLDAA